MKKTKIICSIGPASNDSKTLSEMAIHGMNVARINFSHGGGEEQDDKVKLIRNLREELNLPISLLLDTKGPEIRIGKFENNSIKLNNGDIFTLYNNDIMGLGRIYGGLVIVASTVDLHSTRKGSIPLSCSICWFEKTNFYKY